jgi:hypothetical protein
MSRVDVADCAHEPTKLIKAVQARHVVFNYVHREFSHPTLTAVGASDGVCHCVKVKHRHDISPKDGLCPARKI